jgi:lipoprotein-releasing system permease protein|tara:strand:- start:3713 stop:4915 length:1203 start_codon:yes stop_codon:yes gene_type:complete
VKFAFTIARRFMLGGKGAGPSRLTGWISIIGLAAGTFALIVSLAVLNGFEERVTNRVMGFEGDLRITAVDEDVNLTHVLDTVLRNAYVADALPFQERKGLVSSGQQEQRFVTLKAIPIEHFTDFYDIRMDASPNQLDGSSIYIGQVLARRLNVGVGDDITLMSPVDYGGSVGLPRRFAGNVAGIFQAEVLDVDDRIVFIPLSLGERIFLRKKGFDGIDVRLNDPKSANDLKRYFRRALTGGLSVKSWTDLHAGLFNAMRMERIGTMAVLSLIVLVACFNLMSTLVLVTYQKIREIGILRTLGTTARRIQGIILMQGIMIGGIGAIVGVVISLALVSAQNQFGLFSLPEDIYFIDKLPMVFKGVDLLAVVCISCVFIIISSAVASGRTLKINPREAVYLEK